MLQFTKSERKLLRLLIDNPRITDEEAGKAIGTSVDAVRKIRDKLEGAVLNSYTVDLDMQQLGIQIMALVVARANSSPTEIENVEVSISDVDKDKCNAIKNKFNVKSHDHNTTPS